MTNTPFESNHDPTELVGNELRVSQPGERTICEIRRHPIGILSIYFMTGLLLVFSSIVAFGVVPAVANSHVIRNTAVIALLGLIVLCIAYTLSFTKIYWNNYWIVTTDSVTRIGQTKAFRRHTSQLPLDAITYVTVEQNGMLAHRLNYGVVRLEMSDKNKIFIFNYCPNPNFYGREILAAREAFTQKR